MRRPHDLWDGYLRNELAGRRVIEDRLSADEGLQGRATMRDVARRAGVSIATVSNVLNASKPVAPETARAVEAAVMALGYRPNSIARSLIARRVRQGWSERKARARLLTVGYLSIDYVAAVPALPGSDDRLTARGIEKMVGGPAANVAVFAAGLELPSTVRAEILTRIGDDADSDWALGELAACGVDASGAIRTPGTRLSRCIVLVDMSGARSIVNEPLTVAGTDVEAHLDRQPGAAAETWVHLDGFQVAEAAPSLPALRRRGVRLSAHMTGLEASWRSSEGLLRLRGLLDLVFLNREVARSMTSTDGAEQDEVLVPRLDTLIQGGDAPSGGAVLLTLGAGGAVLLRPGASPHRVLAEPVEPVDTTGAGDAFTGLFLGLHLSGRSLEEALAGAVRGATLSVSALGAQGRRVSAAELGLDEAIPAAEVR